MVDYGSIRFQINNDIENAIATSELTTKEIKQKLVRDWEEDLE